jgi:hypothetical protein
MTRLLEIYYLVGVPLGLGILVMALFWKRKRPWLVAASIAMVGGWVLAMHVLAARSSFILNHYNDFAANGGTPQSTAWISSALGSPELVIDYPQDYSVWFYSVRVQPWNALAVYHVAGGRILNAQVSEETDLSFDAGKFLLRTETPASVRRFIVQKDKVTWVILSGPDSVYNWMPRMAETGQWNLNKEDAPPIMDAAFSYVSGLEKAAKADPKNDPMLAYHQGAAPRILAYRLNYGCQLIGYTIGGKKMIHLNFFPRLWDQCTVFIPGTTEPYWHKKYVMVFDGGPYFWHVEYDPATKTFSGFIANGMG